MIEFELNFLRLLESSRNEFLNFLFKTITYFGQTEILFILIALLYFMMNKEFGRKLIFSATLSSCFNGIFKNLICRPRPFNTEVRGEGAISCVYEDTATGYSFPSGHSTTVSNYSSTFTIMYKKRWMLITSIVISLLVGFSRMFLGCHFPSDVLFGLALGVGVAFLAIYLYDKFGYNKAFLFSISFSLLFCIYFLFKPNALQADLYKSFGMLSGCYLGILFEDKKVNFSLNKKVWKRVVEGVIALGVALLFKSILKLPYKNLELSSGLFNVLDALRYMITCFLAVGFLPYIYKITGFNKGE